MNTTRYIELDSTYRDRNRYPNPSQFQVDLAFNGQQYLQGSAIDPLYYSVMKYPPANTGTEYTYPNVAYGYGTVINGGDVSSDYYVSLIPVSLNNATSLSTIPLSGLEYGYVGDMIELVTHVSGGSIISEHEFRTIVGYQCLEEYEVLTSTILGTDILPNSISLNSNCDIDQFFNGFVVEFITTTDPNLLGTTRDIVFYRGYDKRIYFNEPIYGATITAGDTVALKIKKCVVQVDAPFSIPIPILSDSCDSDNYTTFRIRNNTTPILQSTFVSGTENTFTLPVSAGNIDYNNYLLWITTNPIVHQSTLGSASFVSNGTIQIQGTFVLTDASLFPNNFFNNMTITMTSGTFSGYSFLITDWDQSTQTGTITPGWTSLIVGTTNPLTGDSFTITQPTPHQYRVIYNYNVSTRTGNVQPFSYTNLNGVTTTYSISNIDTFDLLKFFKDNVCNLDITESSLCYQNAQCFEIQLLSLTLPNVELKSGHGGSITFYPYVYVEFKSVTNSTSINNLYSNNPNAQSVMFKAPMIFYFDPSTAFITLDGYNMIQTVKFKPRDSFRFSVYLPNGELFITEQDYVSPASPNELLQISACFSFKRLG